jgi:hypothetical protein
LKEDEEQPTILVIGYKGITIDQEKGTANSGEKWYNSLFHTANL